MSKSFSYGFLLKVIIMLSASMFLSCTTMAKNGDLIAKEQIANTHLATSQAKAEKTSKTSFEDEVDVKSITYMSDGLKVKAYLAIPKQGENLPCIIYNRGGNREFGALADKDAVNVLGQLASWGYVVIASQYRGNAGGEGREEFGGADVNDLLNLLPVLEKTPRADATRIGMYGWSRGGMMAYKALTKTDRFSAVVVGAAITDLFDGAKQRPETEARVFAELIPDYAKNRDAELRSRSAIFWPEKLHKNTPILMLHGSADWRVNPAQALSMANKLYETQHPFRFVFFEGGDHGLTEHRKEVNRLVRSWFDTYVKDKKPWPSLKPHGS